ncbi:hypothetical protein LPMP_300840 [Leishmania panamensis]|uniref:Uncharacterized protein n=1 Tax=Leishmania panamensis TaxID=5679 RepID=A0A088RWC2_LEIPA|nr:hypothetical protein LPMP_300840 [Leishmania panamensis]AIO00319.1 hypothetical protein LPMP_300840 [Leishmania panamensis]
MTTLSTAQEDAHAHVVMKEAPHIEKVEWTGGMDCSPTQKLTRQVDFSLSQSTSVKANDVVNVEKDWANTHLVERDEVVDAIQCKWWETLDADVRPGLLLPSASTTPMKVGTPDAETLGLVRELLSHASDSAPKKTAVRSSDNALLRCEVPLSKRKEQRTCLDRSPASEVPIELRKHAKHTASRSFHPTVPRGPSLHTERLAHLRGQCVSTATMQRSEGEIDRGKACRCSQDHDGVTKDITVAFQLSSRPEGQCRCERESSSGTGTATPLEAQSEVFSPSAVLQGVLCAHTKGISLSSATAVRMETLQQREELLLLRRSFAMWLTAASQRYIQQCAASYHCFLMQCINDTIGDTTSRVKRGVDA